MATYIVDENGVVQFIRPVVKAGKTRGNAADIQRILNSGSQFKCPACASHVKGTKMRSHLAKVHRFFDDDLPGVLRPLTSGPDVKTPQADPLPTTLSHVGDRTRTAHSVVGSSSDGPDGGFGYAHTAREGGRFGSMPKFDDYNDESGS